MTANNHFFDAYCKRNTNMEYHSDLDVLSSTMLKNALLSPLEFVHSLTAPSTSSKATSYGTMMHTLISEPHCIDEVVAIAPFPLGNNTVSRVFRAANPGRFCITMADFQRAKALAQMTLDTPFKGRPFYKFVEESIAEESTYYTDPITGLACRVRHDLKHPDITFDLKTTRHQGPRQFANDAQRLHYDLSAFMYTYGRYLQERQAAQAEVAAKPFVIVAIFNTAPHGVFMRPCTSDFMENGRKKYEAAMQTIAACKQSDYWPTASGTLDLSIEPWQQFNAQNTPWLAALDIAAMSN